eukprot:CAMPEP_0177657750 /NCGR_PEP_ID=MMETSP0447-20121125/16384_1 /TAXON_ID=0 /ORGANISM="Stygamoeba regulata, Strain BSH-02190019" /LENGTH=210 /DNA_ID=CAMNT_0019162191 /DNA_START=14 /DNA_END=646 /DNA_ORIENTATION=+
MVRIFAVAVLVLAVLANVSAYTFQVEPKSQECFYESIGKDINTVIDYHVLRGGLLDIRFEVALEQQYPDVKLLIETLHFEDQHSGRYEFVAPETGTYRICFDNRMSRFTAKVVEFSISVNDGRWGTGGGHAKSEHFKNMDQQARQLSDAVDDFTRHQHYLRAREIKHRNMIEETNSRVVIWSIVESTVLFAVSLFQIYTLRRFFEIRKVV